MSRETVSQRRTRRNRFNLKKLSGDRLRLSVFRSNKQIAAQIIDDKKGVTVVSVSSANKGLKLKSGNNVEAAQAVGKAIAEAAKAAKVKQVVFDRGGYIYHGRVKALAEAAREAGLDF